MSRRLFSLLSVLLLPTVVACDPADPCEVAATVEPSMRIGVGEKQLRLVEDGDHLEVTWGMQGGRHIWVGVHTEGVATGKGGLMRTEEEGPDISWTLTAADGTWLGEGSAWGLPLDGDETGAELAGQELYLGWYTETGEAPDLSDLLLHAELSDKCGTELIDEHHVTADL